MKHDHPIGLTLAEGARRSCDTAILEALAAAEAEAARFEAMDLFPGRHDTHRGMLKSAAYFEAEHQRCQLLDDLRRRLLRGELVATARERPTGPRGEVAAEAWAHLYPHMNDDTARDGMGVLALYEVRITPAVPVVAGSLAEAAKAWMIQTRDAPWSIQAGGNDHRLRRGHWLHSPRSRGGLDCLVAKPQAKPRQAEEIGRIIEQPCPLFHFDSIPVV